jgi:cell division septal protein FtsQ
MFQRSSNRRAAPATRPRQPAALRPGARPGGGVRRTRPVRRASAGITPTRAGALLALLLGVAGLYGAVSSEAFTLRHTDVTGLTWTSEDAVLTALAVPDDQNLFSLRTGDLETRLTTIPAIEGASVTVALPDVLQVAVTERTALLVWKVGDRRLLVDRTGLLFAEPDGAPSPVADALPVVDDRRLASAGLIVGSELDPVVLDAALRLGSLRPVDVGSAGTGLGIRLDDANGFVIDGVPAGWTAIFGFYTPTLRTTELIQGQVRLLRSLVLKHPEEDILQIILADDRSGTYIPRSTAAPSPTPKP